MARVKVSTDSRHFHGENGIKVRACFYFVALPFNKSEDEESAHIDRLE